MNRLEGCLFVVATPLGNLQDITFRAVDVLKRVSIVAAEDTRRTRKLLAHLGIHTRLVSCNEYNESKRFGVILECLAEGRDAALVSDAGTPGISDPGAALVSMLRQEGACIIPVPGPSAVAAALSVCGMKADRYHFAGFLPAKRQDRIRELEKLSALTCPIVFFEAPHRIVPALRDMLEVLGHRNAFLAREITKVHETYVFSTIAGLVEELSRDGAVKGEITLVVQGADIRSVRDQEVPRAVRRVVEGLLSGERMSVKDAASLVAEACGMKKGLLYELALGISKRGEDDG